MAAFTARRWPHRAYRLLHTHPLMSLYTSLPPTVGFLHIQDLMYSFFCEEGRSLLYLSWFRTCSVKSSSLCKCYFVIALCGHVPGCQVWVVTPQQGKRHCSSFRPHLDAQRVFSPVVFFLFFWKRKKKKELNSNAIPVVALHKSRLYGNLCTN